MTPDQWARVLRAGRNAVVRGPVVAPGTPLAVALTAMAHEAEKIAEETR